MKRLIRERTLKRVVATLKSGSCFVGILYAADSEAFILRDAKLIQPDREPTSVDGEVLVMRADLDYLQLP